MYSRLVLTTYHGYDGDEMKLGKKCGSQTEYDIEASLCALIEMKCFYDRIPIVYFPRTKRQIEQYIKWKNDLELVLKVDFSVRHGFINGSYIPSISEAFPTKNWKGQGNPMLVLSKSEALSNTETLASDIYRGIIQIFKK